MAFLFWYFLKRFFTSPEGKIYVLKEIIAYFYVTYFKSKIKRRLNLYDYDDKHDLYKVGFKVPPLEWNLECPTKNLDYSENVDSIQFYGVNSKYESLFVKFSKISQDLAIVWLQLKLSQDTTYILPVTKEWKIPKTGEDCFAAGGLRIRCLTPMRKWRISYNGILSKIKDNTTENVHVKFSFIWLSGSDIYDLSTDIDSVILANFLAKQTWRCSGPPDLKEILKYMNSYEHAGNIIGTVSTCSENEEEVYLWGCKKRGIEIQDLQSPTELIDLFGYMKDGESFHASQIKFPHLASRFTYGYLQHSNGLHFAFKDCEISLPHSNKENRVKTISTAEIVFHERKMSKKIRFGFPIKVTEFKDQKKPTNTSLLHVSPILYDDETGYGIITSLQRPTTLKIATTQTHALPVSKTETFLKNSLVIAIENLGDNDRDVAGGKGASLGQLTNIGHKDKSFSVPKGLVLTIAAYAEFLSSSATSRKNISLLEDVASGKIIGVLQDVCANTVKAISKEKLPDKIQSDLKTMLDKIFPRSFTSLKFAVRSSATGEDSEELSAAGQMETLLGIKGFDEIIKAVVKCWASQFSYIAVQYKRQNGQVLNSSMAVVVQEMVPADAAGVIFTCDPLTGNPEIIAITANYGIGESVVSATADPDTITMKRDAAEKVHLQNVQIGQKKTKFVMQEHGSGTEEQDVNSTDAENCCLPEYIMTTLAELAIKIENAYACPMDIEWAIIKEKIYLLQARPVTTFDRETDFEIMHENDTFLQSEFEYTTIANIGEVLPGALAPLSNTVIMKIWNLLFNRCMTSRNPNMKFSTAYGMRMLHSCNHRMHINVLEGMLRFHTTKDSFVSIANIISAFGRLLDDEDMYKMALKRTSNYPNYWKSSALVQIYYVIKSMLTIGKTLQKNIPRYKNYAIHLNHCRDVQSMLDEIKKHINQNLIDGSFAHLDATTSSSFWNLIMLHTLQSANGGWNNKVFSDFSMLLSSITNVESADIPKAMQKLSNAISNYIDPSEFKAMETEYALKWLKESEAKNEFQNFLDTHGHRCVQEFDIHCKPWVINPLPMVKILQEMVGRVSARVTEEKTVAQLINNLQVPLSFTQKLILKFILPFARRGVRQREMSKSTIVRIMHIKRLAFLKLAKQMVEEGRIPDEDLMFFLSADELEQLMETRSPRLIQKAKRRRAIHPKLGKDKYPEISRGFPKPINMDDENEFAISHDATLTIKGVPVSRGIAKGPARVATTLEEAQNIQQGEILIAHGTDIGWSPYFPLLAGVCTELGGLISHGAVVAREYGLPCVVAVHNATRKFKTGDMVLLDGNVGVLQLLN